MDINVYDSALFFEILYVLFRKQNIFLSRKEKPLSMVYLRYSSFVILNGAKIFVQESGTTEQKVVEVL